MYVYINKKKVKKREKKNEKKNAIVKEKTKLDFHSQIKTPKKKKWKMKNERYFVWLPRCEIATNFVWFVKKKHEAIVVAVVTKKEIYNSNQTRGVES